MSSRRTSGALDRKVFEFSRAAEYFSKKELSAQTGQSAERLAAVVLKELVDNALDAAESAGREPFVTVDVEHDRETLRIQVADNGLGIPASLVDRVLDFSTRTSDKAHYRAPTRGAQGNALKTILGIPTALGSTEPVIIEAQGSAHRLRAWVDPAGEVRVQHETEQSTRSVGTAVSVTLPEAGQVFDPLRWARAYALFNPHAEVKIRIAENIEQHAESDSQNISESYHATASDRWRKWLPTDPTSPHWYSDSDFERLIFAYIAEDRRTGGDRTIREFVREFSGLTGSKKAKAVTDQVPFGRLAELEDHRSSIGKLHRAMCHQARAPKASSLGLIGEEPLRERVHQWLGVQRHWYRKTAGEVDGVPFAFEVLVAQTRTAGGLFSGLNHSATFSDPLADTSLIGKEVSASSTEDFLAAAHAPTRPLGVGYDAGQRITAVVHLICPALQFLDRGKTRLNVPAAMAEQIAEALCRATRTLYRDGERRRKDVHRQLRARKESLRDARRDEWTMKDAVYEILPKAINAASGGGDFDVSARTLFYSVRPLVQDFTDADLDYNYFSQTLLPEYQRRHGPIECLYYDPRGVLYEPHTGREIQLGTREVDSYDFPEFVFDKLLYVEKKGLWPILRAAQIGERFDMAIVAAEGFASEAARTLLRTADQQRGYQIFVLHDADPAGYEIARTLGEETRRMPGFHVDVIDLGLSIKDAVELDLQAESFTRRKKLPRTQEFSDLERAYFEGRQEGKSWIARRIELNAFTAPGLVGYLERKLREAGVTPKVVPPEKELQVFASEMWREELRSAAEAELARLVDLEALTDALLESVPDELNDAAQWINEAHRADLSLSWRTALRGKLQENIGREVSLISGAVRAALPGTEQGSE